jgi:hypothetical protein
MPATRAEPGNLRAITRSFRPISQQYGIGDPFFGRPTPWLRVVIAADYRSVVQIRLSTPELTAFSRCGGGRMVDLAHWLPGHVTARSERKGCRRWPLLVEVRPACADAERLTGPSPGREWSLYLSACVRGGAAGLGAAMRLPR